MAGNPSEGLGDDFFEQILEVAPGYPSGAVLGSMPMVMGMMPVEQTGYFRHDNGTNRFRDTAVDVNNNNSNASSTSANSGLHERDTVHMQSLLPSYHGQLQSQQVRASSGPASQVQQPFHSQAMTGAVASASQPCAVRPRVRARRGQATDPHSIAERLRRERIAERMKALQEIVPSCNKTDRAAMLDEIVDYVKFLRLQVKVLSMSRLGGASAVAQLVADVPQSLGEGEDQPVWEKWSTDGTEEQVAKLMEEDIGAAMQFLQSKALCIMPISLASAIFRTHQPDAPSVVKPESDTPS